MNNDNEFRPRRRNQSLFIVEGKYEKNELIELILKIYPEIDILLENILIYNTHIYHLYEAIVNKYGEQWNELEVDLPLIVSEKEKFEEKLNKINFTDIVLIFDYERHAPTFSEVKINQLQEYFNESTENGKLYINYPVLESYQDFLSFPDMSYENKSIPVSLQPGKQYKSSVKGTEIEQLVHYRIKLRENLMKRWKIGENEKCLEKILHINPNIPSKDMQVEISEILKGMMSSKELNTAKRCIVKKIVDSEFAKRNKTYYEYMREIFDEIIISNIQKANKIQKDEYNIPKEKLKQIFNTLNYSLILKKQNDCSIGEEGIVWVLNTSVHFVPDYNFNLI